MRSGGGFLAAKIAHADEGIPCGGKTRSGDIADLLAVARKGSIRRGRLGSFETQAHADAVDLAAGAHAFDDFLSGVTAFRVGDVRVLEAGFVWNLFFAEVVAEPRIALFEPDGVQRFVARRCSANRACRIEQGFPEFGYALARRKEFAAGVTAGGATDQKARDPVRGNFAGFAFDEVGQLHPSYLLDSVCGAGAFEGQRSIFGREVGQGDIVHDDVFVERGNQPLANHGVRDAKQFLRAGVGFDFRLDMPLRVEKERDIGMIFGEVFDVVGQDRVQVAYAIGPGEPKISLVVLVDERYGFAERAVFRLPIHEAVGQVAAEPHAHLGAAGAVRFA